MIMGMIVTILVIISISRITKLIMKGIIIVTVMTSIIRRATILIVMIIETIVMIMIIIIMLIMTTIVSSICINRDGEENGGFLNFNDYCSNFSNNNHCNCDNNER